ncbi:auxin efflux carrier superfamily [Cladophialophora carrionii]|uniref:Auxin efflux carrier superfamily n=1 Tax=Cladophialophora carrionii TaxID=86049 RepID=A0A1C1CXF7_9EURO|nr:auxin efflux carrier superfamily [Cladophialophora carrionii]
MAQTGLLDSFLAAIQASLSVLLVIFYGGVAAHLKLLNGANTKAISKICVRMFLPALLIVDIGSQLHSGSANRYLIIFVWALICHFISFVIGIMAHFWLGMPDWTTVALMFNNTTSYPLLLVAALDETGILRTLIVTDETTSAMVARAKSYFLVFATVSSCLTFAVGPRLIDTENAPEVDDSKEGADDHGEAFDAIEQQYRDQESGNADEQTALLQSPSTSSPHSGPNERRSTVTFTSALNYAENAFFPSTRRSSIGPRQSQPSTRRSSLSIPQNRRASIVPKKQWYKLGPRAKWWLLFISDFFNAPLLGAIIGAVIGLVPVLHRSFFNDTYKGGIFTAWLTASLKSIGGLFVPLPVVVAGVSLYTAMKEARNARSDTSADKPKKMPWITVTFIMVIRFVIWPAASIYFVYLVAKKGTILGSDPMLWFAMMLMPTGPPAMKLITLIQVSDAEEEDERNIAKLLTISYLISPILSFTVVGALQAARAAIPG